jgi:hypothetical protein
MLASNKTLTIDIAVELQTVKSLHSIGALQVESGLSASIFHLWLITGDITVLGAHAEVIRAIHTNADHVTLNDDAYNASRNVTTGTPYQGLVAGLVNAHDALAPAHASSKIFV